METKASYIAVYLFALWGCFISLSILLNLSFCIG